jgi:hypothetical protein
MVGMLASNAVDHGFKPWSGQTKDYKIGICYFCTKHADLKTKSTDELAVNQDTVDCCFSEHYKDPVKHVLV